MEEGAAEDDPAWTEGVVKTADDWTLFTRG